MYRKYALTCIFIISIIMCDWLEVWVYVNSANSSMPVFAVHDGDRMAYKWTGSVPPQYLWPVSLRARALSLWHNVVPSAEKARGVWGPSASTGKFITSSCGTRNVMESRGGMDADKLEEGVWKEGGGVEEGREGRVGLSWPFNMVSASATVQVEACWELKMKRAERPGNLIMALSGLDSTPRAGKSLKGASWSAFSILVTQGMLGEGGGSKRAGHLLWGTVGDLRMRRSQEESLWGTRWAGGLEQQLLGQRWVS